MNKSLVLIPLFFLLLVISPSFAETDIITAIADSTVYNSTSNFPLTNGGNLTIVQTQGHIMFGFLKFNLSSIPANVTITGAYLDLFMTNSGSDNVTVYNTSIYNTSGAGPWAEGTCQANPSTCYCSGASCAITANITFNNAPRAETYQDAKVMPGNGHANSWVGNWTVTDAVKAAYARSGVNQSVSLILNTSAGALVNFASKETANDPKLYITYSVSSDTCGTCGIDPADNTSCYHPPIIGSYCDMFNNTGIITTLSDCTFSEYYCPTGTVCGQITPQVNISDALVQNFVDCSVCWFAKVWSVQNGWQTLWTNCPNNPECDNCNGIYCQGNNFVTNLSSAPASADYYTAGCYNPSTQTVIDIIDQNGTHTSVQNLTQSVFPGSNYTYNGTCANTSTTCYSLVGGVCQVVTCPGSISSQETSTAGQAALALGSLFGITSAITAEWFLVLIAIGSTCFISAYFAREAEAMPYLIIFGALCYLIGFTLAGWLPAWIMIIIIVLAALLLARKLGLGD